MADDHPSFTDPPSPGNEAAVRDRKAELIGRIKGAGAMAAHPLQLDPDIDLTKPIYEQVLRKEIAAEIMRKT